MYATCKRDAQLPDGTVVFRRGFASLLW